MFASLMRKECSWYDKQNNSSVELSARLAGDANALQGVSNCSKIYTI